MNKFCFISSYLGFSGSRYFLTHIHIVTQTWSPTFFDPWYSGNTQKILGGPKDEKHWLKPPKFPFI